MERNDPVEIVRVNNGFIVNCVLGIGGPHRETHVFQTVDNMLDWLERHFGVEPVEKEPEELQLIADPTRYYPPAVDPHWDGIQQQRDRFEESARQRYLNTFGTDAMTEAEIRAAGG